jgi:hypothetical protein
MIGRLHPVIAVILPFYAMGVYWGWRAIRAIWLALFVSGASFALSQFVSFNYLDYAWTDVLAALGWLIATIAFLNVCSPAPDAELAIAPATLNSERLGEGVARCCDSAGTCNPLQTEIATKLRDRKVTNLESLSPKLIAAADIGCITQIANGTPFSHIVWRGGCETARGSLRSRNGVTRTLLRLPGSQSPIGRPTSPFCRARKFQSANPSRSYHRKGSSQTATRSRNRGSFRFVLNRRR